MGSRIAAARGGIVGVLMVGLLGCTSSYVPAAGPRLSLVMAGGNYAYVRDGRPYSGGLFGGDIVEAVHGVPAAEAYAHAYKAGTTVGLVMALLGAAAGFTGLGVWGADVSHSSGTSVPPTGPIVLASGLVVEFVGAVIGLEAVPHLFDAVNAYNDAVLAGASPSPAAAPATP